MSKAAYEPISKAYLFPVYATAEDAERATGKTLEPFSADLRPKRWIDPNPVDSGLEGSDGNPTAEYRGLEEASVATGTIKTKRFSVPLAEASMFNIPRSGPGMTNVPGADVPEYPAPLKELAPTQILVRRTPMSGVEIRNMDVPDPGVPGPEAGAFTAEDRLALQTIRADVKALLTR